MRTNDNVLIVVVGSQGLNVRSEIRDISELQQSTVLYDPTKREIYDAVKRCYKIIFFGCHAQDGNVVLSDGDTLDADEISQIAAAANAECVFLNTCEMAGASSTIVNSGIPYAIRSNFDLADEDAWKMPLTFFRLLFNGCRGSIPKAFHKANARGNVYGIETSPTHITELLAKISEYEIKYGGKKIHIPAQYAAIVVIAYSLVLLTIITVMNFFGGR